MKYTHGTAESYQRYLVIAEKLDLWDEKTRYMSSISIDHSICEDILKLDEPDKVNIVFDRLTAKPSWNCMALLGILTKGNGPDETTRSQVAGKYYHQIVMWIDWWENKGKKIYGVQQEEVG
jgi:hypothetical protein